MQLITHLYKACPLKEAVRCQQSWRQLITLKKLYQPESYWNTHPRIHQPTEHHILPMEWVGNATVYSTILLLQRVSHSKPALRIKLGMGSFKSPHAHSVDFQGIHKRRLTLGHPATLEATIYYN